MSALRHGDLVTVTETGPAQPGIVFDVPSNLKVVVALRDPKRGPVFRTVHPRTITVREEAAGDDPLLQRLIRRTPVPSGKRVGGGQSGQAARAAHTRAAGHRTTGK
jgi:ribosomal protein S17